MKTVSHWRKSVMALVIVGVGVISCGAATIRCPAECPDSDCPVELPYCDNCIAIDLPDESCTPVWHFPCKHSFRASFTGAFAGCCSCHPCAIIGPFTWSVSGSLAIKWVVTADPEEEATGQSSIEISPQTSTTEITSGSLTIKLTGTAWPGGGSRSVERTVTVETGGGACKIDGNRCRFSSVSGANRSVAVSFDLGRGAFGKALGAISIKQNYPTNILSTPLALKYRYATNSECEVITNSTGIRQVKVSEGLLNVITNTALQYFIEYYPLSAIGAKYTNSNCTGCYTISGTPLSTNIVENPDATGATTNQLRVIDSYSGATNLYEWRTNGWEFVQGAGFGKN